MNKEFLAGLAWGGGVVVVALIATLARKMGFVEADTVTRLVIGANGLMMAWYGNRIPKAFVPNALARRAKRVAGWSLVLSGLVYAGLFAFAPLPMALWGGAAAVLGGIVVTIGYCFSLHAKTKTKTA
jgi:hypothetical protein